MSEVLYVAVDEYSSECHQGTPWAWLDFSEVYPVESRLNVSNGKAPKGWGEDCVYKVSCRASPADVWDPRAEVEDGDLYVPPVTVINGCEVVAVEGVPESDVPKRARFPYSPDFPHTKWYCKITLAAAGAPTIEGVNQ